MAKRGRKRKIEFELSYYLVGLATGTFVLLISYVLFSIMSVQKVNTKSVLAEQTSTTTFNNPRNFDIPILMYHYVEYVKDDRDTIRKSLDILPPIFENQIKTLKDAGYTFLTPRDINSILANQEILPKKPIILSFDDGYGDFYSDVLPVLKKYNVKAIEYVISGVLDQPNYMTKDEVKQVIASNLVEIGCHTVNHIALKDASEDTATREIAGCESEMWDYFGIRPVSFAYPYGSYSESNYHILKAAGLRNAVTTDPGVEISSSSLYDIPRVRPGARMGSELTTYLEYEVAQASSELSLKQPASE